MDEDLELEQLETKYDKTVENQNDSLLQVFKTAPRITEDLFERDTRPARDIDF